MLDGTGNARGTGEYVDYPVQAVYRAIGYFGSALPEIEFDHKKGVIPNAGGRVPAARPLDELLVRRVAQLLPLPARPSSQRRTSEGRTGIRGDS